MQVDHSEGAWESQVLLACQVEQELFEAKKRGASSEEKRSLLRKMNLRTDLESLAREANNLFEELLRQLDAFLETPKSMR